MIAGFPKHRKLLHLGKLSAVEYPQRHTTALHAGAANGETIGAARDVCGIYAVCRIGRFHLLLLGA